MRTLEKAIRTANLEKKNWKQEMNVFLRQYRATLHNTTDVSPSEALNGRKLQTLLPQQAEVVEPDPQHSLRERDTQKKKKMKEYADQRRRSKPSVITVRDTSLFDNKKQISCPHPSILHPTKS